MSRPSENRMFAGSPSAGGCGGIPDVLGCHGLTWGNPRLTQFFQCMACEIRCPVMESHCRVGKLLETNPQTI